jgi:hypothetical protein
MLISSRHIPYGELGASMVAVKAVERGAKTNNSVRRLPSSYTISMVAIKYLFTLV